MSKPKYTITLFVYDRVKIPDVLPRQAKFEVGIVVRDIRKKLQFTQDELEQLNIQEKEGGRIVWNVKTDTGKAFQFTELEMTIIRGNLKTLDGKEELPTDDRFLDMYEKFIEAKKDIEEKEA